MNPHEMSEITDLFTNSGSMFGLLARIYRTEMDQEFLDELIGFPFVQEIDDPDIQEGNRLLEQYLKQVSEQTVTDLAVDYARVFLGVGPKPEYAAIPYESVYTSDKGLVMQEAKNKVKNLYLEEGLELSEASAGTEDHIANEMVFLQHLLQQVVVGLLQESPVLCPNYFKKVRYFLKNHLMNWIPDYCDDVLKGAGTDFYKGIALLTKGFLKMFDQTIAEMDHEYDLATVVPMDGTKAEESWDQKRI